MTLPERLNATTDARRVLELTLDAACTDLRLSGGWAWRSDPNGTFYLAATHGDVPLPRKLLGGWCWCLGAYGEGKLSEPTRVSEIKCSRLDQLGDGTALHYHACVPLTWEGRRMGLINYLYQDDRQLQDDELTRLGELTHHASAALFRCLSHDEIEARAADRSTYLLTERLGRLWRPPLDALASRLERIAAEHPDAADLAHDAQELVKRLNSQLDEVADNLPALRATTSDSRYPAEPLTEREREVLTELGGGRTNAEIGERLFVSERTVKFHVGNLLKKLGADNRTQAVAVARRRGWLY